MLSLHTISINKKAAPGDQPGAKRVSDRMTELYHKRDWSTSLPTRQVGAVAAVLNGTRTPDFGVFNGSGRKKTRRAYERLRGTAKGLDDPCGAAAMFYVMCEGNVEHFTLSFGDLGMPELEGYSEVQFDSQIQKDVFKAVKRLLDGAPALAALEIGRVQGRNHVHLLVRAGTCKIGRRDRKAMTPARFVSLLRYLSKPVPIGDDTVQAYVNVKNLQKRVGRRLRPLNVGRERVTVREAEKWLGIRLLAPKWEQIRRSQEHGVEVMTALKVTTRATASFTTPSLTIRLRGHERAFRVAKIDLREKVTNFERSGDETFMRLAAALWGVIYRKSVRAAAFDDALKRVRRWELEDNTRLKDVGHAVWLDELRPCPTGPPPHRNGAISPPLTA